VSQVSFDLIRAQIISKIERLQGRLEFLDELTQAGASIVLPDPTPEAVPDTEPDPQP